MATKPKATPKPATKAAEKNDLSATMSLRLEVTHDDASRFADFSFHASWYGVSKRDVVEIEGRMLGMLNDMHAVEAAK